MTIKINSPQLCLGLSVLGSLAIPGAASAAEDLDTFMAHYEGLQRSLCVQDVNLATQHLQRMITANTLPAYRYYTPVIMMTPRCPHQGLAVTVTNRGEVRPQTREAFYWPAEATAPVETAPVEGIPTRQRHRLAAVEPVPTPAVRSVVPVTAIARPAPPLSPATPTTAIAVAAPPISPATMTTSPAGPAPAAIAATSSLASAPAVRVIQLDDQSHRVALNAVPPAPSTTLVAVATPTDPIAPAAIAPPEAIATLVVTH